MPASDKADIIRGVFAAYLAGDRAAVERALADDFRFTTQLDVCFGAAYQNGVFVRQAET